MAIKWTGALPQKCDLCRRSLSGLTTFVDGRTQTGQWANMCLGCHRAHGCGLGTGKGQKFSLKTGEKVGG